MLAAFQYPKAIVMANKINLVALAAGIATLVLIVVSVFVPWWQFTVGKPALAQVNFSPANFNFALFGNSITMPLILAINVIFILTLVSGAITMIIYSIKPNKSYSKQLLGFGYKKPLYAVIAFVVEIVLLVTLANTLSGFNVPLSGAATMQLPQNIVPGNAGVNVGVDVLAAFGWPFYFAIVVAGLCVAARIYHRKIVADAVLPPLPPQP
jgi:hypothetical protein